MTLEKSSARTSFQGACLHASWFDDQVEAADLLRLQCDAVCYPIDKSYFKTGVDWIKSRCMCL